MDGRKAMAYAAGPLLLVGVLGILAPGAAAVGSLPGARNCWIFPRDNVWNKDISKLPVASNSDEMISAIGADRPLHPDFGSYSGYGIPYNVVTNRTPRYSVRFVWPDESNLVKYPIPPGVKREVGSDRHIILLNKDTCYLYELYRATKPSTGWRAGSGAVWNLRSNRLRPPGWTSADAAGLPILAGLVRYDEVAHGVVYHAFRFTAPRTRTAYIYPARHQAGESSSPRLPPMGLRIRLKAAVDISGFGPQSRVVLAALKRYGMLLADNGSPLYVTGSPDPR